MFYRPLNICFILCIALVNCKTVKKQTVNTENTVILNKIDQLKSVIKADDTKALGLIWVDSLKADPISCKELNNIFTSLENKADEIIIAKAKYKDIIDIYNFNNLVEQIWYQTDIKDFFKYLDQNKKDITRYKIYPKRIYGGAMDSFLIANKSNLSSILELSKSFLENKNYYSQDINTILKAIETDEQKTELICHIGFNIIDPWNIIALNTTFNQKTMPSLWACLDSKNPYFTKK